MSTALTGWPASLGQRQGEAAGAAAHFERRAVRRQSGEVAEGRRQPLGPASEETFVGCAVGCAVVEDGMAVRRTLTLWRS